MKCWYVYVLQNADEVLYTGIAKNVEKRLQCHNAGKGAKFTKGRGPWHLEHVEGPLAHGDALRREIALKQDKSFKSWLKTPLPFCSAAEDLPALPGAYALLMRVTQPLAIHLPKQPPIPLPPGHYIYCGSAKGPGGLKSRVGRHMRSHKTLRWHIDQITTQAQVLGAWLAPHGDECALVARFGHLPPPIPGFGSSDCPHCRSHLLLCPPKLIPTSKDGGAPIGDASLLLGLGII